MADYDYVIIGGGMTGDAAVRGIRQSDLQGSIAMLSEDAYPPYNRPPLTKGLWKGKPVDQIWRGVEKRQVDLHLRTRATQLDRGSKTVQDDQGNHYRYRKLLLATGGTPRRLPFGDNEILYYRNFGDYELLRAKTAQDQRFAVIGGGFIGSEIAAALRIVGKNGTILFPEPGICSRIFPKNLSDFVTDYYRQKGVTVIPGVSVTDLQKQDEQDLLTYQPQGQVKADVVLAGIGIVPNTGLAKDAGLEVENGIIVNEFLQTSDPDIYAAGDVANFFNPALDMRMRVEHEDNANTMGETAGKNMTGERIPYHHLPFFYSDLFELGYEAVGELDSRLETVEDWQEPFKKGVIYYLRDGRLRGVLLWNVWGKVDAARQLIARSNSLQTPINLVGQIG